MFAYCLNNPVNLSDKTGKAADSYAGWLGELIGEWLYELLTGETHPNKQARELEIQVIAEQNEMIANAGKAIWDAYVLSNELAVQEQYHSDMMIKNMFEAEMDRWSADPALAGDFAALSASAVTGYISYAAFAAGVSIPVVGQAALICIGGVCVVWAGLRYFEIV